MKKLRLITFVVLVSLTIAPVPSAAQTGTATAPDLSRLPLSFVPNAGQTNHAVHFQVRTPGGTLFFTSGQVVLALPTLAAPQTSSPELWNESGRTRNIALLRLRFEDANPTPAVRGAERLPGIVNYFIGNDPTKWHTNLPTYAGIVYRELYPGIDLHYDGAEGLLKGTYTVAPGADPECIRWRYDGATSVRVDETTGDLLIQIPAGGQGQTLIERAPVAWQSIDNRHVPVSVRYAIAGDGSIGFALGDYDPAYPLTLDPTLIYSTYLGGCDLDDAYGIAVDSASNAHVIGRTLSSDFPTKNPLDETFNSGYDIFVTKLNATGNALLYSTYLGGSNSDESSDIAVDSTGNAYITGYTRSSDFPIASPLYGTLNGISDIFVAKLNATGSALLYSTYLGGSSGEYSYGIAVDGAGNAYVAGATLSSDFPTANALDETLGGGLDATVTKLNTTGSALVYSTYLGGSSGDAGYGGIAVDSVSNVYITGYTQSDDFPTVNPLSPTYNGGTDVFVTRLNAAGDTLLYSTYLGGSNSERSLDIAVDNAGNTYLTGYTNSDDFPIANALYPTYSGGTDAFVTKLNATGSALFYSTYLGGSSDDTGEGIATDRGNAYITGSTSSTGDFPADTLYGMPGGDSYAFMTKLDEYGTARLFSTYLGGNDNDGGYSIAVDTAGNVYVTGWTESTNFPTQNPFQAAKAGPTECDSHDLSCQDAFVTKIDLKEGEPNWAFILYLDGDNNLYPWLRHALDNLETATTNSDLTVLVLLDGDLNGDTRRYNVQPDGNYTDGVNRWSMGELDMGDPQTLSDFITWARDNYPARHYYLAVADHGRGTTGIAWDDTNGSTFITVAELRTALQNATSNGSDPLDVLHYDACLMGMLENAYQIQDYADYLIASENEGWSVFAYDRYAAQVTSDTTPEQLATAIVDEYYTALTEFPNDYPLTISALHMGQAGAAEDAVSTLATALQTGLNANKYYVSNSRDATQKFDSRDYCVIDNNDEYLDLYDFARLIKQNHPDASVKNAAQGVMDAVNMLVIAEHHHSGYVQCDSDTFYWDLDDAHGVSIYFPPASNGWGYDDYMGHVSFRYTVDGQWDEFLQDYFGLMGLPPETPLDPGLPPMLPVLHSVYLPVIIK